MKYIYLTVFILLLVVVVGMWSGKMKKNFPYDIEVVPGDRSLSVINTNLWTKRDCVISLEGPGISGNKNIILPAKSKEVIINDLFNGQEYKITVTRSDFLGKLRFRPLVLSVVPKPIKKYIIFIGASIAQSWNLRSISKRLGTDVFFGYRGYFEFDKTPLVESVSQGMRKPDVVIIKECAAYFPRETEQSLVDVDKWVKLLIHEGIEPVLATVVPITKELNHATPGRMQSINAFNSELRDYAEKNDIKLIDMQSVLSATKSQDGFLDEAYANSDGLHLNYTAYRVLDEYLGKIFNLKN